MVVYTMLNKTDRLSAPVVCTARDTVKIISALKVVGGCDRQKSAF